MAGFGTTMSKLIEDDREYYRELATKKRDHLQTYGTKAVVDIEGKANDALAVANQLQNYGFSKEFVTGITAKGGVRSMYDFANQVLKRTDLTPDDIKELETSNGLLFVMFFGSFILNVVLIVNMFWSLYD